MTPVTVSLILFIVVIAGACLTHLFGTAVAGARTDKRLAD